MHRLNYGLVYLKSHLFLLVLFDKIMAKCFISSQSVLRVLTQKSWNQVFCFIWTFFPRFLFERNWFLNYVFSERRSRERSFSNKKLVHYTAKSIHVTLWFVRVFIGLSVHVLKYFGCHKSWRANTEPRIFLLILSGETEVDDLEEACRHIDQHILRFDVTVCYSHLVQMRTSLKQLLHYMPHFLFIKQQRSRIL